MISNMMTTLRVDDDYYVENDAGTYDHTQAIILMMLVDVQAGVQLFISFVAILTILQHFRLYIVCAFNTLCVLVATWSFV